MCGYKVQLQDDFKINLNADELTVGFEYFCTLNKLLIYFRGEPGS